MEHAERRDSQPLWLRRFCPPPRAIWPTFDFYFLPAGVPDVQVSITLYSISLLTAMRSLLDGDASVALSGSSSSSQPSRASFDF
jgi:hypothetical protein